MNLKGFIYRLNKYSGGIQKKLLGVKVKIAPVSTISAKIQPIKSYGGTWDKRNWFSGVAKRLSVFYRFLAFRGELLSEHEARAISARAVEIEADSAIQASKSAPIVAQPAHDVKVNQKERVSVWAKLAAYRRAGCVYIKRLFMGHKAKAIAAPGAVAAYREEMALHRTSKAVAADSAIMESRFNTVETANEATATPAPAQAVPAVDNAFHATNTAQAGKAEVTGANINLFPNVSHSTKISFAFAVDFRNYDGTLLHTEIVRAGESCPCPVTAGTIEAPTRESDVQYHYPEFIGWSATNGGEADGNLLDSITKPISVYAVHRKELRYYTISFYDDDSVTLLHSVSVAYGDTPSYIPTKDGFDFSGWNPEIVPVTGEASYYASWEEAAVTFATGTWAQIAAISESGQAQNYFAVGDKKKFLYNGTTEMEFIIIGFNHDNLADGSGKAGITMACLSDNLPQSVYGYSFYSGSTLRTALNGTMKNALPSDLQAVLKQVAKPVDKDRNTTDIATTNDYLFVFSTCEYGALKSAGGVYNLLGTKYSYFDYTGTQRTLWIDVWTRNHERQTTYLYAPAYGKKYSTIGGHCRSMSDDASSTNDLWSKMTTVPKKVKFGCCI